MSAITAIFTNTLMKTHIDCKISYTPKEIISIIELHLVKFRPWGYITHLNIIKD